MVLMTIPDLFSYNILICYFLWCCYNYPLSRVCPSLTTCKHSFYDRILCVSEFIQLYWSCTQQELAAVGPRILNIFPPFCPLNRLLPANMAVCRLPETCPPVCHALLLFGARLNSEMLWPPAAIPDATISNKCLLVFLGFPIRWGN